MQYPYSLDITIPQEIVFDRETLAEYFKIALRINIDLDRHDERAEKFYVTDKHFRELSTIAGECCMNIPRDGSARILGIPLDFDSNRTYLVIRNAL